MEPALPGKTINVVTHVNKVLRVWKIDTRMNTTKMMMRIIMMMKTRPARRGAIPARMKTSNQNMTIMGMTRKGM
jgi:hypothetical protein